MNTVGESTVNSSTQARLKYGTTTMAKPRDLRMLQTSIDSSVAATINSGTATPDCGIISPLSGVGVARSIHLPSLHEEKRTKATHPSKYTVRQSMQPNSSNHNALETSNAEKAS